MLVVITLQTSNASSTGRLDVLPNRQCDWESPRFCLAAPEKNVHETRRWPAECEKLSSFEPHRHQANEARRVPACHKCNQRLESLPPMLFPRADFQNARFGQQASSSCALSFPLSPIPA
jgi:hypothetical protein